MDDLELVRELLHEAPAHASTVARGEERLAGCMAAGERRASSWLSRRWHPGLPGRRGAVAGLALVTCALAAAIALAATGPAALPKPPHHPLAAVAPGGVLSARDILLSAAVSAANTRAAGRYWVVANEHMRLQPAGTAAHPYDISDRASIQAWYPRSARQRYWYIARDRGARPATSADEAAWRAVGSPVSWRFGGLRYGLAAQRFTMSASPAQAYRQPRDGAFGFLTGTVRATFARLQGLPSDPARLRAVLRRAAVPGSAQVMTPAVAGAMFDEGVWLLTQPVTPQVRASVYKVIATLPGVRSAGQVKDPFGRPGYGVAMPMGGGVQEVIVVSPATGALLASEQVVTTPGRARVTNWASKCRYPHQLIGISTAQLRRLGVSAALCTRLARDGTRYVQYGTRYQGQITFSDVYTKVGWTNAFPHLPAARPGPASAKG